MLNYGKASIDKYRNYTELRETLDNEKWQRIHTLVFLTLSSTFFVWGVVLAIGPLVTSWPIVSRGYVPYVLLASPIGLLSGNLIMGYSSDLFGRRKLFLTTITLTVLGLVGVVFSSNVTMLISSIFIAEFGLGGDETVSLSVLAEFLPIKYRGSAIIAISNVANIAITIVAFSFMEIPFSVFYEKLLIGVMAGIGLVIALLTRLMIPESMRWAYMKKNQNKARLRDLKLNKYSVFKFLFLSSMATTIVVGFALTDLVFGPYLFPKYSSLILFSGTLGGSLSGIFIALAVRKISRKGLALLAYTGAFVTMVFLTMFFKVLSTSILPFMLVLLANGVFSEFGWASREMLQPELFTTMFRGAGIASVRGVGYSIYIIAVILLSNAGTYTYLLFALVIFGAGFVGSIAWYFKGMETSKASIV